MKTCDTVLVGYAVNSTSGGFTNGNVKYVDTVGIKYLYSHFYGTYCAEPVAYLQLAAELRKSGLTAEILDGLLLGYTRDEMEGYLREYDTDVFCFTLYESSKTDVLHLMHYVKKLRPGARVITGGPYVTLCYRELMETEDVIDYIVIGDADAALPRLVRALKDGTDERGIPNVVYRSPEGRAVLDTEPEAVDMDDLQPLERDFEGIIREKGFSLSVVSSRGCGHGVCSFCYLKEFQKNGNQPRYRYRSADLVVKEMKDLIGRYGIEKLTFVDDDFFGPDPEGIDRAEELFRRIREEDIHLRLYMNVRVASVKVLIERDLLKLAAQAGVKYFFIGFESYNDEILKRYHKGITTKDIDRICEELDRYQIEVNPGMITFDYEITPAQVRRNVDLLRRIRYYDAFMFTRTLMKLPNENRGMRDNRIRTGDFLHLETEELYDAMVAFRDRIYPLFGSVDRNRITDELRNTIIDQHFACFYEVCDAVIDGRGDREAIMDRHYGRIRELTELCSVR